MPRKSYADRHRLPRPRMRGAGRIRMRYGSDQPLFFARHCRLWNISRLFPTFRRGNDRCDFPAGLRAIRAASRGAEAAVHAAFGGLRGHFGRALACQSLVAPCHLRDLSRVLLGHAAGVGLGVQSALE